MTQYSICATHYNNADYIQDSAGVLAGIIEGKSDWELVITDAGSNDGSLDYLQKLASKQSNVHVHVEEGLNIGEGRQLAAEEANGKILIQISDLDAEIFNDERIFEIVNLYEKIIQEKEVMMEVIGAFIVTKRLLETVGGWHPLPVAEERDLGRRFLRLNRIRFCDIKIFKRNEGEIKDLPHKTRRFYRNWVVKFSCGVSFWYALYIWLTRTEGYLPKIGAPIICPIAWVSSCFTGYNYQTYDLFDNYILDFRHSVRSIHPDLWIDPPEYLERYE